MKAKILTSIGCLFLMASLVRGNALLSFDDHNNADMGPSAGTYAAGSSFTFDITLTVANSGTDPVPDVNGLSYWFETSAANNSYFKITNRNLAASSFSDPQTPGLTYPQSVVAGGNANDLGGTGSVQPSNASYFIATITLQIDPSTPPGTYTISTTSFASNNGPKT